MDNIVKELNSCKCPLDGVYLIEASAGTGKTYNIQNLAVRLIVEKGLKIDQILIVTFTRAATAELCDRIRKIIQSSYQFLDLLYQGKPLPVNEDFSREKALLENALQDFSDKEKIKVARERLQAAIFDFDNNAISTIHGFCQKMLKKNAFESGILFQTDLTDDNLLREQIIELIRNQWRKFCYAPENQKYVGLYRGLLPFDQCFEENESPDPDDYVFHPGSDFFPQKKRSYTNNYVPPSLNDFIGLIKHPEISFDAEEPEKPETLAGEIFSLWKTLVESDVDVTLWYDEKNEIVIDSPMLLATPVEVGYGWKDIEETLCNTNFEKLSEEHPNFSNGLQELIDKIFRFRVSALTYIRENVTKQLAMLKQRDNFQTYDDLQHRMVEALNAEGSVLAETLRTQFKAAIIDEFQDTDQTQYEIFTKIFAPDLTSGKRENCTLFLVGDPKQAIYAFRGGDIFTYKQAAEAIGKDCTYSLSKNFRSADLLVESVNELFCSNSNPFADKSIKFESVESSGKETLKVNGVTEAKPFHCLGGPGFNKHALYTLCANKIFALLHSDVEVPCPDDKNLSRPVSPSDIAVLFRYRTDMGFFQECLQNLGIPYVVNNEESIYNTQEARDLEKLLLAVADPTDIKAVTWLMQTQLAGNKNCRRLSELEQSENKKAEAGNALAEVQEILTELNTVFKKNGFSVMFKKFMEIFEIHERYPRFVTGAQKYSNLLQLRELLAAREKQGSKTLGLLLLWYRKQFSAETRTDESKVILPTDDPAVRIMTIHNSKGLQFPIVFLPDLACIKLKEDKALKYHDPEKNNRIFHRITTGDNTSLAFAESLQEELRIAYVALTRASCANYLLVPKGLEGAIVWLFETQKTFTSEQNLLIKDYEILDKKNLPDNVKDLLDPEINFNNLRPCKEAASQALSRYHWGDTKTPVPTPKISYSSAHKFFRRNERRSKSDEETSGSIAPEQKNPLNKEVAEVFTLPRGDLFGTACHEILERLDFQNPENLMTLIQRHLSVVNIGNKAEIAAEMFRKVISAPLPFGDGTTFALKDIALSDRCSEIDFDFKLNRNFDPAGLSMVLNRYFRDRLEQDQLERLVALHDLPGDETFYTGSADLIFRHKGKFFIVDWKTDILEQTMESFDQKYLFGEMWQKFYLYQSLLYSSALIRFLSLRLHKSPKDVYDQDFGGTIYLFLRGVDPEVPGRGIYADKPNFKLICEIAEVE